MPRIAKAVAPQEPHRRDIWDCFAGTIGQAVRDVSGHGHDGEIAGRVEVAPGVAGASLRFSGQSSFVAVKDSPALSFANATFSVTAWVNSYYPVRTLSADR